MAMPGADWPEEEVRRTIDFARGLRRTMPRVTRALAQAEGILQPSRFAEIAPNDTAIVLAEAAELAFAIDDIDLALEICIEIIAIPPRTPMQFVLWGTAGSIVGKLRVLFTPEAVVFERIASAKKRSERAGHTAIKWPAATSDIVTFVTSLIPAAVVAGPAESTVDPIFERSAQRGISGAAELAIKTSHEYAAARRQLGPQVGYYELDLNGLPALEAAYTRRLSLLRSSPDWRDLQPPGSIIDWKLLLLWIARHRAQPSVGPFYESPAAPEAAYLRDLAKRIALHRQV